MAALLESQNKPGIQFLGARMSLSSCSTESSKKKKKRLLGSEEDGKQKEKSLTFISLDIRADDRLPGAVLGATGGLSWEATWKTEECLLVENAR
jgi:hypothetical protein